MVKLDNSYSLTEFQRNAKEFIEGLNETKDPVLLTVNGKVQAVLVDPATFQEMDQHLERERLVAAILEGERDIQEGRSRPANLVFADLKAKYGL